MSALFACPVSPSRRAKKATSSAASASAASVKYVNCVFFTKSSTESGEEKLTLPNTNMLRFVLPDGAWVVVRPSGTEPKLKLYVSAGTRTKEGTEKRLDALFGGMDAVLKGYLGL